MRTSSFGRESHPPASQSNTPVSVVRRTARASAERSSYLDTAPADSSHAALADAAGCIHIFWIVSRLVLSARLLSGVVVADELLDGGHERYRRHHFGCFDAKRTLSNNSSC